MITANWLHIGAELMDVQWHSVECDSMGEARKMADEHNGEVKVNGEVIYRSEDRERFVKKLWELS